MAISAAVFLAALLEAGPASAVQIETVDAETGARTPSRIHLRDAAGKPVRAPALPFWHDHFICPGSVRLELPPGRYTYEVERGPEHSSERGALEVEEGKPAELKVGIRRLEDLAREGWWSGDLHVHRPVSDAELLMRAEDLHVAPVITWWNERNPWAAAPPPADPVVRFDGDRFYETLGGEDEREGGALLFFGLRAPLAITGSTREHPSPARFLEQAKQMPGAWVELEKPFWWDAPVFLATGKIDSIGLANNHMCRDRMYESEAWGKPRDAARLPPPRGNGYWTQEIYYRVLNCGLRVAPSAGSASGVLPNPVGYNRVYVYTRVETGKALSYQDWWEGLRAGRSFVTNGPLLRARANGELPGHVFRAEKGAEIAVSLSARASSRDPVQAVEIIRDGRVERTIPWEDVKRSGDLGSIRFRESGWFLVRAIADVPATFRFASTAPWYVEIGGQPRVDRESAQFFLDWARERMARIKLEDAVQRAEVLEYHRRAEQFWEEKVARSGGR